MTPEDILHQATAARFGVAVETAEPKRLQQALYRQLSKMELNKQFSIIVSESEVFVIRKGNMEEENANGA